MSRLAYDLPPSKLAYNLREAAAAVGVEQQTLRDAIKAGTLPFRLNGARYLILATDLLAWVESLPSEKTAS